MKRTALLLALLACLGPVASASAVETGRVEEFRLAPGTRAQALVAGPDGNVWFAGLRFVPGGFTDVVGRVTPRGRVREFPLSTHEAYVGLSDIVVGSDGNLWFAEGGRPRVGRITPSGQVTEFELPSGAGSASFLTVGPDGNVWYTDERSVAVGRVTPSGEATAFRLQGGVSAPFGIAAGYDGALWVGLPTSGKVVRVATDGSQSRFRLSREGSSPIRLVPGPGDSVWFSDSREAVIGRIAPDGESDEFPAPGGDHTHALSFGPGGDFWYSNGGGKIGSMTPSGSTAMPACIRSCRLPITDLAAGPGGKLWFAAGGEPMEPRTARGTIGTFAPPPLTARILAPPSVRAGSAVVPVRCEWGDAGDRCAGRLRLVGRAQDGSPGLRRPQLLAERGFRLSLGAERRLSMPLPDRAAKVLASGGRLVLRSTTIVPGGRRDTRRAAVPSS
jgi:virginiamycin B lyase